MKRKDIQIWLKETCLQSPGIAQSILELHGNPGFHLDLGFCLQFTHVHTHTQTHFLFDVEVL